MKASLTGWLAPSFSSFSLKPLVEGKQLLLLLLSVFSYYLGCCGNAVNPSKTYGTLLASRSSRKFLAKCYQPLINHYENSCFHKLASYEKPCVFVYLYIIFTRLVVCMICGSIELSLLLVLFSSNTLCLHISGFQFWMLVVFLPLMV